MNFRRSYLLFTALFTQFVFSQEGIAVYSDYLSDNLYLLHPSMAGASECGKIRLTGRNQWFGVKDAPALQTLSFNTSVGERSGVGAILFNDKNGYHSQSGAKFSYAHHLRFSRSTVDLDQLSFGVNASLVQSKLVQGEFYNGNVSLPDPLAPGTDQITDSYFNVDIGASYFFLDFYTHFTVKNVIATKRELYSDIETDNLRKYLWSTGYVFSNDNDLLFEPSFLFQYVDQTKEKFVDLNFKVYKEFDSGKLWGGISYRRSFDGAQYIDGSSVGEQKLQYITPIVGINYNNFMFAYTYSHLTGNVNFDTGGFHQLTLGINIFCKSSGYNCNCPAVNN